MKNYLKLDEIAQRLDISIVTLRRYIKSSRLKAIKIGREYKINPQDAEEFIKSFASIATDKKENLNQKFESRDFPSHHEHHESKPHSTKNLRVIPGVNSHVLESITEMISQHISFDEIQEIISEYANDCLDLIKKIKSEGVNDVQTALNLLLIDEAIRNLQIRRQLFNGLIKGEAILILPLPPHLSDSLLAVAPHDNVFASDGLMPPHLKFTHCTRLDLIRPKSVEQDFQAIRSVALEGYMENNLVYSRLNVVNFINQLPNLEEIFVNLIPHIPPHAQFVELDLRNFDIKTMKL